MAESRQQSDASDASTGSTQELVEDVLREAQALLGDESAASGPSPVTAAASPPYPTDAAEVVDVQRLVAQVDGLLGELGHLVDDVESAEEDGPPSGLDLTLVLPKPDPEDHHRVPDHGPEGPQVDLFATPAPTSAADPATPTPEVMLETTASPSAPEAEADATEPPAAESSMLDDLASALDEEFERSPSSGSAVSETAVSVTTTVDGGQSSSREEPISPEVAAAEASLLAAMTEEFGTEPTVLPPVEDEGDPFALGSPAAVEPSDAARRLEDLLAQRLAEEFDLSDPPIPSTTSEVIESASDFVDLAQADIDAVTRAEMEALEALGSNVQPPSDLEPSTEAPNEVATVLDTDEAAPAAEPAVATVVEEAPEASIDATEAVESDHESIVESEVVATEVDDATRPDPRPKPRRNGPSILVRLGAAPFRHLPSGLQRHATPVALSLMAWVPLAWGYAILAPRPSTPSVDVLRTGFDHEHATPTIQEEHAASSGDRSSEPTHGIESSASSNSQEPTAHATPTPPAEAPVEHH